MYLISGVFLQVSLYLVIELYQLTCLGGFQVNVTLVNIDMFISKGLLMLNFKSTGGSGAVKYEQIIYYFYSKHTNLFSVKKSECYINFLKK